MASKTCCRSCPRCADCPVVAVAAARARRRERAVVASLIEDVLIGAPTRRLPEPVVQTLEALDAARRARRRPAVLI
jgi:hypothetical protein